LYHGDDINNHRRSEISKRIDVYTKNKIFIKTYDSIISVINEMKLGRAKIQRCLRTDNHLAGDYLLVPHGFNVE